MTASDREGPRLRLGVVGAGAVARAHLAAADTLPTRFAVTAVADPDLLRARSLASPIGAVAFASCEELASSGIVDAAVVGSPHGYHRRHAITLLERGIPVLVEKPMALTPAECREMIEVAERLSLPLAVGHLQRFMPLMVEAKRLVAAGELGSPVLVVDTYSGRYERSDRAEWFFDPALAGHGILANLGGHCLDRLMFLTSTRSVSPDSGWLVGDDVPIHAMATGTAGGVRSSIVLHGIGFPTVEVTDIACLDGAIRVSSAEGLSVYRGGRLIDRVARQEDEDHAAFSAQLEDFHRAIVDAAVPAVPGEYGLAIVEAIERVADLAGRWHVSDAGTA